MTEEFSVTEVCRLCTLRSGVRMHIFDKEGEQRQILFKIRSCLPIIVSKEDTLPKKICHRCAYKLDMFYEFRLNCLNSETMLKNVSSKDVCSNFPLVLSSVNIYEYQRNWLEHRNRMNRSRIPKAVINYCPGVKRSQGRPRKRWRENSNLLYRP